MVVDFIFLFEEFPELSEMHWRTTFNKALTFFFTRTREEFEVKKKGNLNSETYEYLKNNLPEIKEETI